MHRAPKHRRRQSTSGTGKNRVDVNASNAYRVEKRGSKIRITRPGETIRDTLPQAIADAVPDQSSLTGDVVLTAKRLLPATLKTALTPRRESTLRHLAKRYGVRIEFRGADASGAVLDIIGDPDAVREMQSHAANHSRLNIPESSWSFPELARESTGGDAHIVSPTYGMIPTQQIDGKDRTQADKPAPAGRRYDETARRGESRSTDRADGQVNVNRVDHLDARDTDQHGRQRVRGVHTPPQKHVARD